MAEIRVFHQHRFLCRAICPELARDTIALREIIQAHNHWRKALRHTLQERARTVEALLEAHRGYQPLDECAAAHGTMPPAQKDTAREQAPKLKRYYEEALAAVIRVTGGNFCMLHRLVSQIARLVEINALHTVACQVVEAARESLVIGTA
jgi:hypothetical protein